MPPPAIAVHGLRKKYGDFEAVRGIDFDVAPGEVFGLLGPNGAGKTTTVEILEGIRARTGGDVSVLGFDPNTYVQRLKQRIGVALQSTNLPDKITVSEALQLFAAFYDRSVPQETILKRLQLHDKRHAYYGTLSGGQKQRLALAIAMINDPKLVFLDEPTTGLDPQVRLEIYKFIEELKADRRTTLLTTHYIEEAERLCDRVAIIDEGRIIALGTPREIQARTLGHSHIEIACESPLAEGPLEAARFLAETLVLSGDRMSLTAISAQPARTVVELVKFIDQTGAGLSDIHLKRPTLEDVFLELTGKKLRD